MRLRSFTSRSTVGLLTFLVCQTVIADEIRVAVAANFIGAMDRIVAGFEASSGHDVTLAAGSTGKHYAQIRNGAPFDLFLAADAVLPERLEEEGLALAGTRFTYAIGRLVLWSRVPGLVDGAGEVLAGDDFRFLAVANPKVAPYGRAAREVLEGLGVWERLSARTVRGENVAQAFAFVESGNADLGFVAYSQVRSLPEAELGSMWVVPPDLHSPIEQQVVLLSDRQAARAFLAYLRTEPVRMIIRDAGYEVP